MKRIRITFIIMGVLFSYPLFSSTPLQEKKFYADIKVGYGFPFMGEGMDMVESHSETRIFVGQKATLTEKSVSVSYGQGLNVSAQLGYMINRYIGVELGLGYLNGLNRKYTRVAHYSKDLDTNGNIIAYSNSFQERITSSSLFTGSVSVLFTPGFARWNPYLKVGTVFYAGRCYDQFIGLNDINGNEQVSVDQKFLYTGIKGVGLTATLGAMYNITEMLSVFAEFTMNAISCSPSKYEMVKFDQYNDVSQVMENKLESMSYRETHTEYVKEKVYQLDDPQATDNEAEKVLKPKMAFGNMGISLGVKFRF